MAEQESVGSYAERLASRPRPTGEQVQQIADALGAIQPELSGLKLSRVESWSDSMCGDIWTGVDGTRLTLAQRAAYRFNGGSRPPLSDEQGQEIVDLITSVYCHR